MKKERVPRIQHRGGRHRVRMRPWLEDLLDHRSCPGLRWQDCDRRIFEISWKHASGRTWKPEQDSDIFKRYAIHTGKYKEGGEDPDHKKWKANFRCALNSLADCKELTAKSYKKGERAVRVYQFVGNMTITNKKNKSKKKNVKKYDSSDDSEEEIAPVNLADIKPQVETAIKAEIKEEQCMTECMETSCIEEQIDDSKVTETEKPSEVETPVKIPGIPYLPYLYNTHDQLMSGGTVKVSEQKPFTHGIDVRDFMPGTRAADGDLDSNSTGSGETMTDEEVVDMVDDMSRSRGEEGFSETESNGSGSPQASLMSNLWNYPILDQGPVPSKAVRVNGVVSVVTETVHTTQLWSLTALK